MEVTLLQRTLCLSNKSDGHQENIITFNVKLEVKVVLDHQATVSGYVTEEPYETDELSEAVDDLTLLPWEIMNTSQLMRSNRRGNRSQLKLLATKKSAFKFHLDLYTRSQGRYNWLQSSKRPHPRLCHSFR